MITVIYKSSTQSTGFSLRDDSAQFYSSSLYRINSRPHTFRPPTDIYETDEHFIVLIEIAGMREIDFTVVIDRNILTVNGVRSTPIDERRAFHQMEIPFGDFITQVDLPAAIEIEKAEAAYDNGFLRVVLPKEKPKRVEITRE